MKNHTTIAAWMYRNIKSALIATAAGLFALLCLGQSSVSAATAASDAPAQSVDFTPSVSSNANAATPATSGDFFGQLKSATLPQVASPAPSASLATPASHTNVLGDVSSQPAESADVTLAPTISAESTSGTSTLSNSVPLTTLVAADGSGGVSTVGPSNDNIITPANVDLSGGSGSLSLGASGTAAASYTPSAMTILIFAAATGTIGLVLFLRYRSTAT